MARRLFIGFCWLLLGLSLACQPEEEELSGRPVSLLLSHDTLSFDTLFTTERSTTRRLWLHNPAQNAVQLDRLALEKGAQSPYLLFVYGQEGRQFSNIRILGGDSLLVLLEVNLPTTPDSEPYPAFDRLLLENQGLQQTVVLKAYGQNARFLSESTLACDEVWTADLPYVISKSVLVDSLCTLRIEKGARLYFKPGASLFVKGSLLAEGDSAQHILFRNQRQDGPYADAFGQWGGLVFLEGSKNNRLSYCILRNADTGIRLGSPDEDAEPELVLAHCRIENMLTAGILAFTSDLYAYNTLVNNCAGYTVANLAGGNYRYEHCTFANYFSGLRENPVAVFSDNVLLANEEVLKAPLSLHMLNTIVWGNLPAGEEWLLDTEGGEALQLDVRNNVIRSSEAGLASDNLLSTELSYQTFRMPEAYNYMPDSLSPAVDAGLSLGYMRDLTGALRDEKPDIGALEYRYLPSEEE